MNRRMLPTMAACVAAAFAAWTPQSQGRVTKIVVDRVQVLAADPTYETITGRAFGELDPNDPHNAEITDLRAAAANGNATSVASVFLVKPIDMSRSSGFMLHDVPNRGGRIPTMVKP